MFSLRSAREEEIQGLAALGLAAWEKAVSGLVDARAMRHVAELSFLSFLRSRWFFTSVVEMDNVAAGWAAREEGDGEISDLWIDPAVQRRGLGSLLLADLERRIRDEGFEAATISTHAQNAQAIAFFRKHGYAISWLSNTYAPKLDRDVDAVGMTKILNEAAAEQDRRWF